MPTIKAPMPGVLYHRSSPDAEPYVTEGAAVVAGQTIALIEVMKTFNEVKADAAGTVARFLVDDGEEVSAGEDIVEVTP
ncbi:acetyl-CoA carboxylase [Saccharopolyspora rosea]|uniref:Biotin carboxyl carrier protein of acetyl-CoA carboxylase n=1 Tax=Saccharopolyspora rosea TaxID=524884 RepID=A0ABW3FRK6_9PSEU|nr:acetyl-CoA carboxylase [Saccharopolyspora rosea]